MDTAIAIENVNGFLNSSPLWIRWVTLFWVFLTLILVFAIVYLMLFGTMSLNEQVESVEQLTDISEVDSHYEAVAYDLYLLRCNESESSLSTLERRICWALLEARHNLKSLIAIRKSSYENSKRWIKPKLSVVAITDYIKSDMENKGSYETDPEHFNIWVQLVNSDLESLKKVTSLSEYQQWLVMADMTLDDLIFAFGFVEWVIGYDIREKLSPKELYEFGPFMDKAFSDKEPSRIALRYFMNHDGSPMSYIDVVGQIE